MWVWQLLIDPVFCSTLKETDRKMRWVKMGTYQCKKKKKQQTEDIPCRDHRKLFRDLCVSVGAPVMDDRQTSGAFFPWLSKCTFANHHAHTCYLVDCRSSCFELLRCFSLFPISSCCIRMAELASALTRGAKLSYVTKNCLKFTNIKLAIIEGIFLKYISLLHEFECESWPFFACGLVRSSCPLCVSMTRSVDNH